MEDHAHGVRFARCSREIIPCRARETYSTATVVTMATDARQATCCAFGEACARIEGPCGAMRRLWACVMEPTARPETVWCPTRAGALEGRAHTCINSSPVSPRRTLP